MGFRELFRFRGFAMLWMGQTISRMGDAVETLALIWIALKLTGSATFMGLVGACSMIPNVFLMSIGGVYADRWNRKRIMVICDVARGSIIMLIPILYRLNALEPYHLCVVAFAVSVFESFFAPTIHATIPNLVDDQNLIPAISSMTISSNFAQIVGLGMGGALIALVSAPNAIVIDGLSFFLSAVTIGMIHEKFSKQTPQRGVTKIWSDLVEGFRFIQKQRVLLIIFILAVVVNFLFAPIGIAVPILSDRVLGTESWGYSGMMIALSVGMLIGGFAMGQCGGKFQKHALLLWGGIGTTLPLCIAPLFITITPYIVGFFIMGFFISILNISLNTLLQEITPDHIRGRVNSVSSTICMAAMPLGMAIAGPLIDWMGVRPLLIFTGIVALILWVVTVRCRTLRQY